MNLFTKTVLILTIGACAPKLLGTMTRADVTRGQKKFPDLTIAQLEAGKIQYETHCGTCHSLYAPSSHDEAGWNKWVPIMVAKANKKYGMTAIDSSGQENMRRYLITMMDAPPPPAESK